MFIDVLSYPHYTVPIIPPKEGVQKKVKLIVV